MPVFCSPVGSWGSTCHDVAFFWGGGGGGGGSFKFYSHSDNDSSC